LTAAVEFDRFAASTYGANFGQEATFALPIESWLESAGEIGADVILGGPPCQGFSALGKRDIDDPRNTLWRAYAETIVRANPTYFIIENVPPFLKSVEFESLKTTTEPGGLLADYRLEPFVSSPPGSVVVLSASNKTTSEHVGLLAYYRLEAFVARRSVRY